MLLHGIVEKTLRDGLNAALWIGRSPSCCHVCQLHTVMMILSAFDFNVGFCYSLFPDPERVQDSRSTSMPFMGLSQF